MVFFDMNLSILQVSPDQRYSQIDFVKVIAIISVILLHEMPRDVLISCFAIFHIWQAVPVFMVMAGFTSSLSAYRDQVTTLSSHYNYYRISRRLSRILLPFTFIWFLQVVIVLSSSGEIIFKKIIYGWLTGGYGPGSFFIPVIVQHLLLFPIIFALDKAIINVPLRIRALIWFTLSVLLEIVCVIIVVPDWIYRLLYIRYVFAVVLGMWIWQETPGKRDSILLVLFSLLYITGVGYFNIKTLVFLDIPWGGQHAPAYFYSCFVIICLWHYSSNFPSIFHPLLIIGEASWHIFLIQMVYFWGCRKYLGNYLDFGVLSVTLSIFICVTVGVLFFQVEQYTRMVISRKI